MGHMKSSRAESDAVIRLSRTEEVILGLLVAAGKRELYGLEMVSLANGDLAQGSIYVYLDRMARKGLVESRKEDPEPNQRGIPRRMYRVTGHGARIYRAWVRLQSIGGRQLEPRFG